MIDNGIATTQGAVRSLPARGDIAASASGTPNTDKTAKAALELPVTAVKESGKPESLEAQPQQPPSPEKTAEMMEELSQRLNEFVKDNARELDFKVTEEGDRVVILVRQSETGEILRAIPPEEAQALSDNLTEGTAGALFSQLA